MTPIEVIIMTVVTVHNCPDVLESFMSLSPSHFVVYVRFYVRFRIVHAIYAHRTTQVYVWFYVRFRIVHGI